MNCAASMVYRVELTHRAGRDLARLYKTINARNSQAASDWFNSLENAILALESQPNRHPTMPGKACLRHIPHSSRSYIYHVIFQVDDKAQTVSVLHIRHSSQKPI